MSTTNISVATPRCPIRTRSLPGTEVLSLHLAAGFVGERFFSGLSFSPASFAFAAEGPSGPLTVNLGAVKGANGLAQIQAAFAAGARIPTVILTRTLEPAVGATQTRAMITLSNAVVTSLSDSGADVSMSFDYSAAEISSSSVQGTTRADAADSDDAAMGFCSGTRLATATGLVAIEQLQIGDVLRTAGGALRRVRWLGHRWIDCARHADPTLAWPIRIAQGAVAPDVPARDLRVSPRHGVLLDGRLIPARDLLNGSTIDQEPATHVEYWQVEFDTHDVLLAEGLAAESYLDTGNRRWFVNGSAFAAVYPAVAPHRWTDTGMPRLVAGPALAAVKRRLLARCTELGHQLTADADVHLLADGKRIEPIRFGEQRMALMPTEPCERLELHCRSFVPAQINPGTDDARRLGICVTRLELNGAEVHLGDEAAIGRGWYDLEKDAEGRPLRRWTSERIELPAGTRLVLLELGSRGHYWAPRPQSASVVVPLRGPRS